MKLVIGIVRPEKANDVLAALYRADVRGVSMSRVQGHGGEMERVETYRGTTVQMGMADKIRFEIAVSDEFVEPTIEALRDGARTGEVGDGKIFVVPLERAVRIRTGETDDARGDAGGAPVIAAGVDTGDTAWMLVATAMVLLMTPALGLFYAGLVRAKNTLNTFMMCVAAVAVATVTWAAVGYSFAFSDGNGLIGGFDHAFLSGVAFDPRPGSTIPALVFFAFQASFCIVTTALVAGAVVERMRFGAVPALQRLVVDPRLRRPRPLGLRRRLADGRRHPGLRRRGARRDGVGLLSGRRGDRGGCAQGLRAPGDPAPQRDVRAAGRGPAVVRVVRVQRRQRVLHRQRERAGLHQHAAHPGVHAGNWFVLDLVRSRQATAIGAATAIVVGCVAITPAGGYISPGWAMALGVLAALPSYAVILWRPRTRLDETLDVLAAHGTAGLVGILFIGFFAQKSWNGVSDGALYGNLGQLWDQLLAIAAAPAYAFVATYGLLKLMGLFVPLRVTEDQEATGLDLIAHGEEAYPSGEGALLVAFEHAPGGARRGAAPKRRPDRVA